MPSMSFGGAAKFTLGAPSTADQLYGKQEAGSISFKNGNYPSYKQKVSGTTTRDEIKEELQLEDEDAGQHHQE